MFHTNNKFDPQLQENLKLKWHGEVKSSLKFTSYIKK